MTTHTQIFEVLIEKENPFCKLYSSENGCYFRPKKREMKHIERRTPEQARKEGEKYGHVRAVRKVRVDEIRGSIEKLNIKQVPDVIQTGNIFQNAIATDEMIWKKKSKVINRRDSMTREKEKIFGETD